MCSAEFVLFFAFCLPRSEDVGTAQNRAEYQFASYKQHLEKI